MPSLKEIKEKHEKDLMKFPNVVGVGTGKKVTGGKVTRYNAVIVNVRKKMLAKNLKPHEIIPPKVGNTQTDVVELGDIRFLAERTERVRPIKGGYSIGNQYITAGTLGCIVHKLGSPYLLSNAHVFVSDPTKELLMGEKILQPGPYDGGRLPDDLVGALTDYIPINVTLDLSECNISNTITRILSAIAKFFGRQSRFVAVADNGLTNIVDCAIATPIVDLTTEVEGIGAPEGSTKLSVGDVVRKSGRTTEYTEGIVTQENVTINVQYGKYPTAIAMFVDQLIISSDEAFSQGGDSGSAIFKDDNVGGLLFAGNEDGTVTVANKIENVLAQLEVEI